MELQSSSGQRLPVLFVVQTAGRADAVRRLAKEEAKRADADPSVVFVTLQAATESGNVLSRSIWLRPGYEEGVALLN